VTLIPVYPPLETEALRRSRGPGYPFAEPGLSFTHLGRGAVWLALRSLGVGEGSRVAMPAYHCGAEVEAVRLSGAEIVWYGVDADLGVDVEDLERAAAEADLAYVISHFGFPLPPLPEGVPVIEDAAHALFSEDEDGRPLGSRTEAAIFCPRKSLGVPDGGALVVRELGGSMNGHSRAAADSFAQPLRPRPQGKRILRSSFSLLAGRGALARPAPVRRASTSLIARASKGDAAARAGTVTETIIGEWDLEVADMENAARRPARLTETISARVDPVATRSRRRANYLRLLAELDDHVPQRYRDLPELTAPLYLPVRAPDRHAAMRTLLDHGVRALEIWPVPHPLLPREEYAHLDPARHELLALPVHQQLRDEHVDLVLAAAKKALT
jgi:DegT/DnrJ/EryC1/StrS aminotransferase family